ncbi:unnamed protein product [Tetraodon nigroviridis]|uniref:(spotted green pufferfish) hypothetical protein n=1 Tax=Tetraodon nigroviridis TaxID=99883 RepID=Q4S821_TETNG|nr:unnamed protein product [Tetraodon nigroviridis]
MTSPVRVIVVGAGNRGQNYSNFASIHPERMKVGVRDLMLEAVISNRAWVVFLHPQVVAVADPRKFARTKLGKQHSIKDENMFEDWQCVVDREKFADAVIICTPDRIHKELIDAGAIGDIVHIQHLEPVGFYHFAHSFVRGNWRNEAESAFSLLAKSCHDIDLIHHWAGARRCLKVSSFGSLSLFRKENKGHSGWPVSVICADSHPDVESVTRALRAGPYGRCVYACDNDVCSNQGELSYDGQGIRVFDFLTQKSTKHSVQDDPPEEFGMGGHASADYNFISAFVSAVADSDPSHIRSGPEETLMSHLLVFEAERSRLQGRVVYCGETNQQKETEK